MRQCMRLFSPCALVLGVLTSGSPVRGATAADAAESSSSKVLDVRPPRAFTRLVSSLEPMLQAAGESEWSAARLHAVLGNSFSFEMRQGGGKVWQEANLDWDLFFKTRPEVEFGCKIDRFQTDQQDEESVAHKTKVAAWKAVRASIDRGVPAVAMSPMSERPGGPRDWGLVVGYDTADETYVIRRNNGDIRARFDEIGQPAPKASFCVLVYRGPGSGTSDDTHERALERAIAFSQGTGYEAQGARFDVDARGLAAFELWQQAIESGETAAADQQHPGSEGEIPDAQYHAAEVRGLRGYAADYLRELVVVFPSAAEELTAAASRYDDVVGVASALHRLFHNARAAGELTPVSRRQAAELIGRALTSERQAIAHIEAALVLIADG